MFFDFLFDPKDGSDVFPQNAGLSPKYTALQPRRLYTSVTFSLLATRSTSKTVEEYGCSFNWRCNIYIFGIRGITLSKAIFY
jgi:hypothetical protein